MPNHHQIYRSLKSKKVLEQACLYLYQGVKGLRYFDHAEREYLLKYKSAGISYFPFRISLVDSERFPKMEESDDTLEE